MNMEHGKEKQGSDISPLTPKEPEKRSTLILIFIFALLAFTILGIGHNAYQEAKEQLRLQAEAQLANVTHLKIIELANWREEHLADAEIFHQNRAFAVHVQNYLADSQNTVDASHIHSWLKSYRTHREYSRIELLDLTGQVRLTDDGASSPLPAAIVAALPEVLASHEVKMVDFYQDDTTSKARLALLIPIMNPQAEAQILSLLLVEIDPTVYLFPFLQQWPVPTTSAETLLVRRAGEEVFLLNAPRQTQEAQGFQANPLTATELPWVKAALGQTGFIEGQTPQGVPVFADLNAIPETPWFLVSQIELAEVYAPLPARLRQIAVLCGALIILIGTALTLVWREQRLRYYSQQAKLLETLRESEMRLSEAQQISHIGHWEWTAPTRDLIVSDEVFRIFELPVQGHTIAQDTIAELMHPDDLAHIRALDQAIFTSQVEMDYEYRLHLPEGGIRWIHQKANITYGEAGQPVRMMGTIQDITERKFAEEQLRQSEEQFRALYETMLDGVVYQNRQGEIISANPAAQRILGQTLDQLRGNTSTDPRWHAVHEDGTPFAGDTHPAMVSLQTGQPVRDVVMGVYAPRDNVATWISINAVPQFHPGETTPFQVYTTFRDITHQKQDEILTQKRLELIEYASNHSYSDLMQKAIDQMCDLFASPVGFFHEIVNNDTEVHLLAWSTQTLREFCQVEDKSNMYYSLDSAGVWADAAREGTSIIHNNYTNLPTRKGMPPGHTPLIRELVTPVIRNNRTVAIVGVGNKTSDYSETDRELAFRFADYTWDIVEGKQTELALRKSEENYRGLMESLDSVIATVTEAGQVLYMNDRAAEQLGGSAAELIGKTLYELFPEAIAERQMASVRQVIREDKGLVAEMHAFVQGQMRWFRTAMQPIHDEQGKVIYAVINSTDIHDLKHTQEELQELNHTLEERVQSRTAEVQDLYNNAPTGYHSLDGNGRFVMINQTELNWLGYTREEIIGIKSFHDLITAPSQRVFAETYPLLKEQGWVKDLEFDMIRKDGTLLPVLLTATGIYDADGHYLQSRSTIFDLTQRKKVELALRESEERFNFLLAHTPAMIFTAQLTEQFPITFMSDSVRDILGHTPQQYLQDASFWMSLVHPDDLPQLLMASQTLLAQGHAVWDSRVKRANGGYRWLATGTTLLRDHHNNPTEVIGYSVDIHEQKKAQDALKTSEAELRQSRDELTAANLALERAARLKDEFLANMSHELRTPLNAILAFSEGLLEQYRGPLNERQVTSVRNIETSGRHLLTLINDILDLSKVEAGQLDLQLQQVALVDVCEASLLFVKEIANKKALKLAFHLNDHLAIMEADAKRLKQMLVNLLSNAVKFTPTNGQISLEVTTDVPAGHVYFAVQDTGIGIAPDDLERLFQPFTQLDSSLSRQHEGTGLGLVLVRRLAELHGGSVTVQSEADKGSCFTITLPYRPVPSHKTKAPDKKKGTGPLRTALIIEDAESAAEQLARYMQELHVRTVIHPHGEGAALHAHDLQPDVILLDLLMPDPSGWEVLSQLKADPRTSNIPVIIISVVDERTKGLTAGAAAYLVKPVSRESLHQTLQTVVDIPGNGRALVITAPPTPIRILLAEDNDFNIQAIDDYLQEKGYQVSIARNGREALEVARQIHPHLVLMDIQMPEMDGMEAIRQLRAIPEFATTPLIALTALAMPGDRERCLAAGANEYLSKPVQLKALVTHIQEQLAHAKTHETEV